MAFVNEYSTPNTHSHKIKEVFCKFIKCCLTPLDGEKNHNTGGVGIIQRGNKNIIQTPTLHKLLNEKLQAGRFALYGINIGNGEVALVALVYVTYGHTNGNGDPEARGRTDDLLGLVFQDMDMQVPGPKFVMGDFNATVLNLPHLSDQIDMGKVFDIGAIDPKYGSSDNLPTCQNNGKQKPSRNGYILANHEAEKIIKRFDVITNTNIPNSCYSQG